MVRSTGRVGEGGPGDEHARCHGPALDPLVRPLPRRVRAEKGSADPREFGIRKVFVGGEPGGGEPAFREHLESEWGARVTEGLGNADMAPVLFGEAPGTGGMRFTGGRHVLVELVDPDSGEPIAAEPGVTGSWSTPRLTGNAARWSGSAPATWSGSPPGRPTERR